MFNRKAGRPKSGLMYRVFFRLSPENWQRLMDRKSREHRRSEAETARAIIEAELEKEGEK